jgi:hypothetical protein
MKSYSNNPLTPRMIEALKELNVGKNLAFASTSVGRPTKQRLAKYGLAIYDTPKDWDGTMHITAEGLKIVQEMLR